MVQTEHTSSLALTGIDGGNPLGFLAAVGAANLTRSFCPELLFSWQVENGAWRPVFHRCEPDKARFISSLLDTLKSVSTAPFDISDKLPFQVESFKKSLAAAQRAATAADRRVVDFLAAFGSEVNPEKEVFQDSKFRMVRSGDSAGQGLSAYTRAIRKATDGAALQRTLFMPWDYRDDGFSLRWDPIEDQRYALRWRDPSKSSLKDGPGTMTAANCLATEALQFYPTMFRSNQRQLATTGFSRHVAAGISFTWPIWNSAVALDTVRSLLAMIELHQDRPPRRALGKRGVVEIYRSQRVQQNQYYSNFSPAQPP
ncbi:MAG: type I-G CRISPR-associated protein, Cas3-extension family [Gammaproteobacteria bacterium]